MQAAPEGPLQPVPADGTPYPLIIDQNGYALHSSPSTVIPTQVAAGQTVTIKVTIHDPTPIAYFAIYLNLQGNDISHLDSDAQIIWDSGQAYVVDRSGLMQDASVTILSEDPDDPAKKDCNHHRHVLRFHGGDQHGHPDVECSRPDHRGENI